jgi:hypothetical protein
VELRKWGLVAACVSVALITMVAANFGFEYLSKRGRAATGTQAIERELANDPTFKALNAAFPDEHAALLSVVSARHRAGASEAQIKDAAFRYMRDFTIRHAPDVAAAPAPELRDYAATQAGFIRALRDQDPQLCAAFAFTGLGEDTQLGGKAERAMRKGVEAQIRAARAGRDNPVARAKPDRTDMQSMVRALGRKGARPDQVEAIGNGGWRQLGASEQCDLGVRLYEAVASLPAETGARVSASLVETSATMLRRG